MKPSRRPANRLAPRRGGRAAALLLFLPSLGLLAFALHQRTRLANTAAPYDAPDAPERLSVDADVEGWESSVEVPGADRLALRLEPLHPDGRRQAFDARALGRRLRPLDARGDDEDGRPRAEPWRLTLTALPLGAERGVVVDSLAGVQVEGLEPLVSPRDGRALLLDEVVDPRASLFRFPDVPLVSGESYDLVFWGPRPDWASPVRVRVPGIEGAVELERSVRSGRRTTQSIAFRDASQDDEAQETR